VVGLRDFGLNVFVGRNYRDGMGEVRNICLAGATTTLLELKTS